MLTVNELFAGIGAFRKALIRLGIPQNRESLLHQYSKGYRYRLYIPFTD